MDTQATVLLGNINGVSDAALAVYLPWLSASEKLRYQRFFRPQRQRQFLAGRVVARLALGRLLNVAAETVVLEELVGHAPRLLKPAPAQMPGFSISHSGDWIACAVSIDTVLGLDIEAIDAARDINALAEQAFDAIELAALGMEPETRRLAAFYRMWGEKEARFKLGPAATSAASCVALPHAELSIVLCSAQPLCAAPRMELMPLA